MVQKVGLAAPITTMTQLPGRRHAHRALAFGIAASATRIAAVPVVDFFDSAVLLEVVNAFGTALAIAGVSFGAIAAHHRAWSWALVAGWALSVLAIFYIPTMFVYTFF